MTNLINLFTGKKLLWAGLLFTIDLFVKPTLNLFGLLVAAIFIDFLTGVIKAKFKKEARTSEGYRNTVVKLLQYIAPVAITWVLSNKVGPKNKEMLETISGWIMMFIIYIEVTSIFENLYEIDKKSVISKFIYRPALAILKFGIEHNPVTEAADKLNSSSEKKEE